MFKMHPRRAFSRWTRRSGPTRRSWRGLEPMEQRLMLNGADFVTVPVGLPFEQVNGTKVVEVEPGQSVQVSVLMDNIEAFQFGGTLFEYQLDLSNTTPGLNISNWTPASGFLPLDGSVNTGTGDFLLRGQALPPRTGSFGQDIPLGTLSFSAPTEPGEYLLTFNAEGTTFVTNFSDPMPTSFGNMLFVVIADEAFDFGDAPDSYGTTLLANGARHRIDPLNPLFLGATVDADDDGQPSADARGDDTDADGDDEDGVIFRSPFVAGVLATIEVTASGDGFLDMWIDFNRNGVFDDPEEYVPGFFPFSLNAGVNIVQFTVPDVITSGVSYARFRFSSAGGLLPTGAADDGEVEDYRVQLFDLLPDFGDAPDDLDEPRYPTLLANDGAFHLLLVADFHLGAHIDFEPDGQPHPDALGDDLDDGLDAGNLEDPDDEDGIIFLTPLIPGQTAGINAIASLGLLASGRLDAWIDFNGDGDWDDPGEQILTDALLDTDGDNILEFAVPAGATPGATFARFRMSVDGNLTPRGVAMGGEVEDYKVTVEQVNPLLVFLDGFELGVFGAAYTTEGDAQVVDVAGDKVAQLTEGSDAAFAREVVLSENATELTLDFRFTNPGDGDSLSVTLDGVEVFSFIGTDFVGGDFVTTDPIDISAFAGQTVTLEVRLVSTGAVNAQIQVDNLNVLAGELLNVAIGDEGAKAVTFTDADGTVTTITLKGGAANVAFTGENLAQVVSSKGVTVTGANVAIDSITITGSTDKSTLTFKSKGGDGLVDIRDIAVDGSLKEINAKKNGRFSGEVNVTGGLSKFVGHTLQDAEVTLFTEINGQASAPLDLQFTLIADAEISTPFGIKSIKADQITSTATTEVEADWLGALTVKNDAALNMTLAGDDAPKGVALNKVKVGTIAGLTWEGTGNVGAIATNDITGDFAFNFSGDVKSVKIKNNATGDFTANSIQTFDVTNNLTDASITLAMAFDAGNARARAAKSFKVKGTADGVELRAVASLGKLEFGRVIDSAFFAGVDDDAPNFPPPVGDDIIADRVIDSLKVKGIKGQEFAIINSNFAAAIFGKVDLANAGGNGGQAYGIVANAFPKGISYKNTVDKTKLKLKADEIPLGDTVIDNEDFIVRLV